MKLRRFVGKGKQVHGAVDNILTIMIDHGGTTLRTTSNPVYRFLQMPTLTSEMQKQKQRKGMRHTHTIKDPHCPDIRLTDEMYNLTPETWWKTCMSLFGITNTKRP
jgi:hypothetical protein